MAKNNNSLTKTKILYVVESFSTGVYAIVRDVACNLDKNKFEVLIIHSLRDDSPKTIDKDFKQPNITLKYVPMGTKKDYLSSIKIIKNITKEYKPDAIHLHSSKAGFLGRLAIKGQCKNVLYSPHGFSFLRTDVNKLFRFIFFQLEFWINKYVPSKIVAVSAGEKEHALKITKNSIVIKNFIDTDNLRPPENFNDTNIITTCGRIAAPRNPSLFNAIAEELSDKHFVWIGDGPLRSEIKASNINVTGLIPRNKAIENIKNASIYLQTSLWEGMPVALLEAMSLGKPVIASNVVGNRDLVTDEQTGFLCHPHAKEQFIDRINQLLESPDLRNKLGTAAREYVVNNHSLDKAIQEYEDVYIK